MNLSLVAFFAVLSAFFGRPVRVAPWVRVRSPLGRVYAVVKDEHGRALALPVPTPPPPDECAHTEESPAYVALLPVAARGSGFAQLPGRALDLGDLDVFLEAVPPVVRAVQLGEHEVDPHALRALLVALDLGADAKELFIRTVYVPEGFHRARRTRIEVAGLAWTFPGAVTRHALAYDPRLPAVVCCTACGERRGRGRTPREALARAEAAHTVERMTRGGLAHYCPDCAPAHEVEYPDDDRDPLELAPPVRVGSGTHRVLSTGEARR